MKRQILILFFTVTFLQAHPNPAYMPLYEHFFDGTSTNHSSGTYKGENEKQSFFSKIFPSAKCEGAQDDDEQVEFSFDNPVKRKPKYTQEEEMDHLIGRFCRLCQQRDGEGIPQTEFIGLAREMVNSDEAYKAEQTYIKWMLFKYPWIKYAGSAAGGALVGALACYAIS